MLVNIWHNVNRSNKCDRIQGKEWKTFILFTKIGIIELLVPLPNYEYVIGFSCNKNNKVDIKPNRLTTHAKHSLIIVFFRKLSVINKLKTRKMQYF